VDNTYNWWIMFLHRIIDTTYILWMGFVGLGCKIFLGTAYQNRKNIPNDHKI
jgi:hypothetical protein